MCIIVASDKSQKSDKFSIIWVVEGNHDGG